MSLPRLIVFAFSCMLLAACSSDELPTREPGEEDEEIVTEPDVEEELPAEGGSCNGFYVLNAGALADKKSSLDFYDYAAASYTRNIYAATNATNLGTDACDIVVDSGKLYILLSDRLVVADASTAKHIAQVDISTARNIAVAGSYAYVSSHAEGGRVVRISTADFSLQGSVAVGLQPEALAIADGKLYVAHIGDLADGESNFIGVVDLGTFAEIERIAAPINLHSLAFDSRGRLWTNSLGDYAEIPASLYHCVKVNGAFVPSGCVEVPAADFTIVGDKLYYIGTSYDDDWNAHSIYGTVDLSNDDFTLSDSFITDGSEANITTPYAIATNPANGDIIIADINNYAESGSIHYYTPTGTIQWTVATAPAPSHIAFVER